MNLPSTGLHYGVSFDDYRAWDAVNISSLKPMAESPLHCKWEMDHPREQTPAMALGSALHIRTFEPARFEKEFYVGQECDRRTKEGKSVAALDEEKAAGRTILRGEQAETVAGMAEALWAHKAARRFLEMPGQCEVSALWKDPVTGLLCKGRFDKLATMGSDRQIIVELKSTRKGFAEREAFGREIGARRYDAQAAYYCWAVNEITGKPPLHVFLPVENEGPYAANWGTLDDAGFQAGSVVFRNWLNRFAECKKSGNWPGYPDSPTPIFSMPNWAVRVESEE